jgi:hypothetical protein
LGAKFVPCTHLRPFNQWRTHLFCELGPMAGGDWIRYEW